MLDVTQGISAGVAGRTEGDPVQDVGGGPESRNYIDRGAPSNGRGYLINLPARPSRTRG